MYGPTGSVPDRLWKNVLYSKYSGISTLQLWTGTCSLMFRLHFSASEKAAVGGNDISVYLISESLKLTVELDSWPAHSNNIRRISSSRREKIQVVNWWPNKQDGVSKQSYL